MLYINDLNDPFSYMNEQVLFEQLQQILLQEDRDTTRQLKDDVGEIKEDVSDLREKVSGLEEDMSGMKENMDDPNRLSELVSLLVDVRVNNMKNNFYDNFGDEVRETVTKELSESRDEFVEAMYPIMGQIVNRYVKERFETLMATISSKVDDTFSLFSIDGWKNRMKTTFGYAKKEELILNTVMIAEVDEIFIIHRDSGLLIGSYSRNNTADIDMIAGMLTAIKMFVSDIFAEKNKKSNLDTIAFGEYNILLLNDFHQYYIATVTQGTLTPNFKTLLNQHLVGFADGNIPKSIKEVDDVLFDRVSKKLKSSFQAFEKQHQ